MSNASSYPVMELFYSLQGEGYHQGKAAFFIRLAGCDVGCVWCDVKDSWDASKHPVLSVEEIVAAAAAHPSRIAIVTGGEPLLHQLDPLTTALKAAGFQTHIETSGSSPMSGSWDWVCLSPKKFKAPLAESIKAADELKVVVFNKSDFDWANSFVNDVNTDCKKYLQPEWEKSDAMTPLVIEYIKQDPSWELSAQLHKYIQVP
ncbi:MAG: 7-carboxy-7-deazaguanine synthase QueE [Sediminibacterium sp.]